MNQDVINYIENGIKSGYELHALKAKLAEAGHPQRDIEQAAEMVLGRMNTGSDNGVAARSEAMVAAPPMYYKFWLNIVSPNELFRRTAHESIWPTFAFNMVMISLSIAIGFLLFFLVLSEMGAFAVLLGGVSATLLIPLVLTAIPAVIVIDFVLAGIFHGVTYVLGGVGSFSGTYKSLIFARTPFFVLAYVPIVNFFVSIWSLVLLYLGIKSYHKLSGVRTAIVIFISLCTIIALTLVPIFLAAVGFFGALSQ